jgi:hypothetical protein
MKNLKQSGTGNSSVNIGFLFLLVVFLHLASALTSVAGTCAGQCGGAGDASDQQACWCDDACRAMGDCCDDYIPMCIPLVVPDCDDGNECTADVAVGANCLHVPLEEKTWYKDYDGDGFGSSVGYTACTPPPVGEQETYTLATAGGDCAPQDPAIHPGAEEICADRIDQDCDGEVECELENIDSLVSFVEGHRIRSIDQLLRALPDYLIENYVLIGDTESLHEADLAHPRLMLFTPDARLILTASTFKRRSRADYLERHHEDPNYDRLEMTELKPDGTWNFRTLDFNGRRPELAPEEEDRQTCSACHGDEPRPIWQSWISWDRTVAFDDRFRQDTEEAAQLEFWDRFESSRRRLGRLSNLDFNLDDRHQAILNPVRTSGFEAGTTVVGGMNHVFNEELGFRFAESLFEKIRRHELYPQLADEFVLHFADCREAELEESIDDLRERVYPANHPASQEENWEFQKYRISKHRILYLLGVDVVNETNLAVFPAAYSPRDLDGQCDADREPVDLFDPDCRAEQWPLSWAISGQGYSIQHALVFLIFRDLYESSLAFRTALGDQSGLEKEIEARWNYGFGLRGAARHRALAGNENLFAMPSVSSVGPASSLVESGVLCEAIAEAFD